MDKSLLVKVDGVEVRVLLAPFYDPPMMLIGEDSYDILQDSDSFSAYDLLDYYDRMWDLGFPVEEADHFLDVADNLQLEVG